MLNRKHMVKIKHGQARQRVMRCVAILFLLYTAVDLAYPQICSEENFGEIAASEISVFGASQSDVAASILSVSAGKGSQRNLPQERESRDEDCFCCCAHIVPGIVFVSPIILEPKSVFPAQEQTSITQDKFEPPFHPPRFS